MNKRIKASYTGCLLIVAIALGGCAGSRVLGEAKAVELQHPLAVAANERVAATLDWVVIKDGPGTWASNAFWDEYRFRIANVTDVPISISQIQVIDSLNTTHVSIADREARLRPWGGARLETNPRAARRSRAWAAGGSTAEAGLPPPP